MKKKLLICALFLSLSSCENIAQKQVEKKEESSLFKNDSTTHEEAPFLFAQRGATATFDGKILTINRVNYTDFFSNKNRKFIKQISNKDFFAIWQEAGNTAVISYQNKDRTTDVATLELTKPKLGKRNSVSYSAKIISGKLPKITSEIAIFIDSAQGVE